MIFMLTAMMLMKPLLVNQLLSRAEAYSSFNMHSNAIRQCKKVIAVDPENEQAWTLLGDCYKTLGDLEAALETYHQAVTLNDINRAAYFKMGMIFALEQNYTRAIPYFEEVRRLGPKSPQQLKRDPFPYYCASLDMLASCYEQSGRADRAVAVLEELIEKYPAYEKASIKLSTIKSGSTMQ
jgi:tetratricopeptide (TPR) repeat protein